MSPELAALCVILLMVAGWLSWDHGCRCEQCAFHTNERRMAALRQAELNHDTAHKGYGWRDGAPDTLSCSDETCPRNPPKVGD